MLYMNWRFTLIALSVAPLLFLVVFSYTRRIKKASREVRKKEGEIVSVMQEVLTSIRVVKAFAREDYEQQRLEEESLEGVEIALRARRLRPGSRRWWKSSWPSAPPGAVVWRAHGADWSAFRRIAGGVHLVPGQDVQAHAGALEDDRRLFKAAVGYERIREIFDTENEVRDLPGARRAPKFSGGIEFENVSFGYEQATAVLRT